MFLTVVHLFIHSFIPFRPIITVYNIEQDKLEIGLTRQKDHLQLEMLACFKTNVFKNIFLPAGCREAANCRYCFHSQAKIRFFAPQGRLVAPIQIKLCTSDKHLGPLGCAKFHVNRCRRVGMRPQKYQKFPLFGKESHRRGDSLDRFSKFLGAFIRLTILR